MTNNQKYKTRTEDINFVIDNAAPPAPAPAVDKEFNLLGASYNGEDISGGIHPDITVPQSSTKQVQRDNQNTAFWIKSMLISVNDAGQFNMHR